MPFCSQVDNLIMFFFAFVSMFWNAIFLQVCLAFEYRCFSLLGFNK